MNVPFTGAEMQGKKKFGNLEIQSAMWRVLKVENQFADLDCGGRMDDVVLNSRNERR